MFWVFQQQHDCSTFMILIRQLSHCELLHSFPVVSGKHLCRLKLKQARFEIVNSYSQMIPGFKVADQDVS